MLQCNYIKNLVKNALDEDIQSGDITASLLPQSKKAKAYIISREKAVIAGIKFADEAFHQLDKDCKITWMVQDGDFVKPKQKLAKIEGKAASILTAERTALNFLQTLSATATQTSIFLDALKGTKTKLLDTRKTIPGLRLAQKYAVLCGGGKNHRLGLYDAFLIKENHIAAFGSISKVIAAARQAHPHKKVEIEVQNLAELKEALAARAYIIMLDNFDLKTIQKAVKLNQETARTKLEVSGDVTLKNIRKIAKTGVDYISVGALTKNIKAINLSLLFT
ncbi:MAG: carboxylating nicotinate-nucleotide diphosphorylase [Gammaproteobacteria bacterium]